VTTPYIDDEVAVVTVATTVVNESTGTRCADALLELRDGEGLVVATEHGRGHRARRRMRDRPSADVRQTPLPEVFA
jgi:hypothetical protein